MAQIPRPKRRRLPLLPADSHGLATSMRLAGSVEQRNLYCRIVSDVAKFYDKHEHRMDGVRVGSRTGPWLSFLEVIQKVHPTLIESYEDAWPVALIIRAHRQRKGDNRRKSLGLVSWTKHMVKSSTSGRREEPNAAPSAAQPQIVAVRSKPSPSQAPSASQVNSAQTKSSIARYRHGGSPTNTRPTGTSTAGGKRMIEKPESTGLRLILTFLNSLTPPQPDLLLLFRAQGVTDTAALRALTGTSMTPFLHGWVKEKRITEFQFAVIGVGLQKLYEEWRHDEEVTKGQACTKYCRRTPTL